MLSNKSTLVTLALFLLVIVLVGANLFLPNKKQSILKNKEQNSDNTLHAKLLGIYNHIPTQGGKNNFLRQSNNLTKTVDPELIDLDSQIITCGANVDNLLSSNPVAGGSCVGNATPLGSTKGMFLGGQCCGTLSDTKEYHEELQAMQKYKDIPDIPLNPYKTPISLAKKWIDYDNATSLSSSEQAVYDQAVSLSKEKGPCCCKCWHYYVNEGIAKKMIKQYKYTSQKIADFWDNSDICGT